MSARVHDDVARLVEKLGLAPHPEGGFYRETFRDPPSPADPRGRLTLIHFLLEGGKPSAWHAVDAVETWHFYDGAPVVLSIARGGRVERTTLGRDLDAGHALHAVVPADAWQSAASTGAWSLVGCAVAPAFRFEGFRLAPAGFDPTRAVAP